MKAPMSRENILPSLVSLPSAGKQHTEKKYSQRSLGWKDGGGPRRNTKSAVRPKLIRPSWKMSGQEWGASLHLSHSQAGKTDLNSFMLTVTIPHRKDWVLTFWFCVSFVSRLVKQETETEEADDDFDNLGSAETGDEGDKKKRNKKRSDRSDIGRKGRSTKKVSVLFSFSTFTPLTSNERPSCSSF